MENLVNIFWLLLLLFPLLQIFLYGVNNFFRKERLVEILLKSAIAFTLYLIVTGIFFVSLIIFLSVGDPAPQAGEPLIEGKTFETRNLISILLVFGYMFF